MKRSGLALSIVVALALYVAPAWPSRAATAATLERGSGLKPGAKRDGRTLTVAELRVCIDIKAAARRLADGIHHKEMSTDVAESRYRGLDLQLGAAAQTLDRTDQREVDAYNKLVREQGAAIDEYNALAGQLNVMLDEHDAVVARFNAGCRAERFVAIRSMLRKSTAASRRFTRPSHKGMRVTALCQCSQAPCNYT